MSTVDMTTGLGQRAKVDSTAIENLKSSLQGDLLCPGDSGYDDARTIWNAMIDRKPALIAMCENTADVKLAVDFAREHGLLTAIHGCGHNIAGNAVCDGGLMINLSKLNAVDVDPKANKASAGPGATLGDLDAATQKHGLATPAGINSTTGIAGLTLGGGFGWLSRKYGMTVDNLIGVEIVTADGQIRQANEKENPDLFWAVRGGGGNFGVVTRFDYKLYKVGPEVMAGLVIYPEKEISSALRQYRELAAGLSDDTAVWVVMRQAPPLPFLPESSHGSNVIVFAFCHVGDAKQGEAVLEKLRGFGEVLGEHTGMMPYVNWQQAFDPLLTPGARNYWKSHNFTEISDGALELAQEYAADVPTPHCEVFFAQLGGAINEVPMGATAYPHRDAEFVMNVHCRWDEAGDDKKCIAWAREFFQKMAPHATGGVYINFMPSDETDRVKSAFGDSWDRLVKAKQKYDPDNLFRLNQNISPNGTK